MDNNEVLVVAAAPGVIVLREDGNYDRNCSFTGMAWNAVYVQHGDGSIAWYAHMKNGSVTPKQVGQSVVAGEYLGVVGSSGNSTAPHLHFELHASDGSVLDPYAGVCNATTPDSLWIEQPAYYDTAVNKITTGYAPPLITECSTPEQSREASQFNPGDTIYFTTYYRDQLGSQASQYTITRPDGTVYQSWQHNIPDPHYAASWWWWAFNWQPMRHRDIGNCCIAEQPNVHAYFSGGHTSATHTHTIPHSAAYANTTCRAHRHHPQWWRTIPTRQHAQCYLANGADRGHANRFAAQ
ncbi:MAG: M23 family metallopeptidase [Anaerolineae bacterium]|nr:M23 family metallopeptidase [Anaerolineae bacterium]